MLDDSSGRDDRSDYPRRDSVRAKRPAHAEGRLGTACRLAGHGVDRAADRRGVQREAAGGGDAAWWVRR